MAAIPRTVVLLGIVSLLTDLSSEMIYPLLPLFLATQLGAGAIVLGIVEGVAESTASVLKLLSGLWTDRLNRRKPFVLAGYTLAGLARPLIGVATAWPAVLAIRFTDRIGKGIRTSPRDALIADVTDPARRGLAYGFHRAMDHAGAVLGPLVAAALMAGLGWSMRAVFLVAVVPALMVILIIIVGIREPEAKSRAKQTIDLRGAWAALPRELKVVFGAVFLFTLGNATDAFILLRLSDLGLSPAWVAFLWAAHHVVKMVSSYGGGRLSDIAGRRVMVVGGWALYAFIYLAFAATTSLFGAIALFLVYGIYYGLVEPSEKAWVADLAPARLRATAMGYYQLAIGAGALPASLGFGLLWNTFGYAAAFLTGATLAASACVLLAVCAPRARAVK